MDKILILQSIIMNQKRRDFVKSAAILGITTGVVAKSTDVEILIPSSKDKFKPITIATWNNKKAVQEAWTVIQKGGKAVDAVEAGARVPEEDPKDTSVGYGGMPDREGKVTLDASIMDHKGNAGAVMFLENILHPISVARLVMEKTPHVYLAGAGALQFALENGFKERNMLSPEAKKAWEEWLVKSEYQPKINAERHDTIGILALDQEQDLSGACSTSGLAFKMRGRVGDSPIIGAGLYVDNEVGAATATGLGEAVAKKLGAFSIVEMMRSGKGPETACKEAIMRLLTIPKHKDFQVGYIALTKNGAIGAYSLQPGFQYAYVQSGKFILKDAPSFFQ